MITCGECGRQSDEETARREGWLNSLVMRIGRNERIVRCPDHIDRASLIAAGENVDMGDGLYMRQRTLVESVEKVMGLVQEWPIPFPNTVPGWRSEVGARLTGVMGLTSSVEVEFEVIEVLPASVKVKLVAVRSLRKDVPSATT